jgi:DNA-binding transcriptional MerR regulator
MKTKKLDFDREDVVSIRDASRFLGVNETTLRLWTDEGRLKAFVTPGGHRRYLVSDLKKFTKSSQRMLGIKDLAVEIEDTSKLHREIARKFMENNQGLRRPDPQYQQHLADLGRDLLALVVKYVAEPSRREVTIKSAHDVGADFGRVLAELGLPLTDSVEAFLSHREPFMRAVVHIMSKRELVRSSLMEAIPLANRFIDETLVSMIAAHQSFSDNRNEGKSL